MKAFYSPVPCIALLAFVGGCGAPDVMSADKGLRPKSARALMRVVAIRDGSYSGKVGNIFVHSAPIDQEKIRFGGVRAGNETVSLTSSTGTPLTAKCDLPPEGATTVFVTDKGLKVVGGELATGPHSGASVSLVNLTDVPLWFESLPSKTVPSGEAGAAYIGQPGSQAISVQGKGMEKRFDTSLRADGAYSVVCYMSAGKLVSKLLDNNEPMQVGAVSGNSPSN